MSRHFVDRSLSHACARLTLPKPPRPQMIVSCRPRARLEVRQIEGAQSVTRVVAQIQFRYHDQNPRFFWHFLFLIQDFMRIQYHERPRGGHMVSTSSHDTKAVDTMINTMKNGCLGMPGNADWRRTKSEHSLYFYLLECACLSLGATPCQTPNHSHSIVAGGLPETS